MQPNSGHGFYRHVEEQAIRHPDRVAVLSDHGKLTYRELSARSNQLARRLRKLGVGAEQLIAICTERSPLLVVGLLGILKAGAAYVPLEATLPQKRIELMLSDTAVDVVLTQSHLTGRFPRRCSELHIDDPTLLEGVSNQALEANLHERNVAYVMYTSGSTGRPKSVAIEHRSALSLMEWGKGEFASELLAGTLASSSVCFDMSVFELFVPLSWGGTVILADSILSLPDLREAPSVTLVSTVPSAIKQLALSNGLPNTLRAVLLAGEPLPDQLVNLLFKVSNIDRIWNLYGVSEDTSYTTCARIDRNNEEPVTIGRPIAGRRAFVLDASLAPAPCGVIGELYVSGVGLARGYAGRPDLTAERFMPHTMPDRPGERMYRTGDLARRLADGRLVCLGRVDNQVKIRGHRVEPGEVEAALNAIDGIAASAVVAQIDSDGDNHLIAYVVLRKDGLSMETIRHRLRAQLPIWMVPGVIRRLDMMPLTTNGKPDRRRLMTLPITGQEIARDGKTDCANEAVAACADVQSRAGAGDERRPYQVTVNGEGAYAIWPADRTLPSGWRHVCHGATKAACLADINRMWTDMRPIGLRQAGDGKRPRREGGDG